MIIVLLLVVGLFAGFLSGLLGIGGGLVFTPILFYLFVKQNVSDPVTFTIATSLFCIILVSSSSTLKHIRQKNFSLHESLWIGLFGIIGTRFGKMITLSNWYSDTEFAVVFSVILLYTAWSFLYQKKVLNDSEEQLFLPIKWHSGLMVGGLGGFVASLAGLGGGIVMVPLLHKFFHKPFHQIVSLTSAAIVVISTSAVVQYGLAEVPTQTGSVYSLGYVDYGVALPLAIGGMIGANSGAKWALKVNKVILQRIFAGLAIAESIRLLANHLF